MEARGYAKFGISEEYLIPDENNPEVFAEKTSLGVDILPRSQEVKVILSPEEFKTLQEEGTLEGEVITEYPLREERGGFAIQVSDILNGNIAIEAKYGHPTEESKSVENNGYETIKSMALNISRNVLKTLEEEKYFRKPGAHSIEIAIKEPEPETK